MFNQVWFGNPTAALNSGNDGQILRAGAPRIVQFGLRYSFQERAGRVLRPDESCVPTRRLAKVAGATTRANGTASRGYFGRTTPKLRNQEKP